MANESITLFANLKIADVDTTAIQKSLESMTPKEIEAAFRSVNKTVMGLYNELSAVAKESANTASSAFTTALKSQTSEVSRYADNLKYAFIELQSQRSMGKPFGESLENLKGLLTQFPTLIQQVKTNVASLQQTADKPVNIAVGDVSNVESVITSYQRLNGVATSVYNSINSAFHQARKSADTEAMDMLREPRNQISQFVDDLRYAFLNWNMAGSPMEGELLNNLIDMMNAAKEVRPLVEAVGSTWKGTTAEIQKATEASVQFTEKSAIQESPTQPNTPTPTIDSFTAVAEQFRQGNISLEQFQQELVLVMQTAGMTASQLRQAGLAFQPSPTPAQRLTAILKTLVAEGRLSEQEINAVGLAFTSAGNQAKQSANNAKGSYDSFRGTLSSINLALNTIGGTGSSMISQLINIVMGLQDAFTGAGAAAQSIIPVVGIFVSLGMNVFGKLINILQRVIQLLRRIASAITDIVKKVGSFLASGIKNLFDSLTPSAGLLNKIKRIFTQYGLGFRSSYFLIRRIRQSVIEGMKDIARQSEPVNQVMSEFSTELNHVKGSLVSAFQPIVSVVLPILTALLRALANVLTAIAKFNAVLVGQDYYYDYAAAMTDYAEGIEGTGKAAKKATKDLMGFDEINRLSDKDSGGGGGSGLGGTFTKTPIDEKSAMSELAEKVKEAWKKADFTEVGRIVGDKLNSVLQDWNSIKTRIKTRKMATKIAKSIGTFINGFVETPELGQNIGEAIANLFNLGIHFLHGLFNTVHWDSVGKFLGDGINGLFLNFNWSEFFITLADFFNSLSTMIINFAQTVEWWEIGAKIANGLIDGLKEWDAVSAGKAAHDLVAGIFDLILGWLETMEAVDPETGKTGWEILGDKISDFFDNLNTKELGEKAGTIVSSLITGLCTAINGSGDSFSNAMQDFADGFTDGMDTHEWQDALQTLWDDTISPALSRVIDWVGNKIEPILEGLWDFLEPIITDLGEKMVKAILKAIAKATAHGFENVMVDAVGFLAEQYYGNPLVQAGHKLAENGFGSEAQSEMKGKLYDFAKVVDDGMDDVTKPVTEGMDTISQSADGWTAWAETSTTKAEQGSSAVAQAFAKYKQSLTTDGNEAETTIKTSFDNIQKAMETTFNAQKWEQNGTGAWSSLTGSMNDGNPAGWFSDNFTEAEEGMTEPFDNTLGWAQGLFGLITTVFGVLPGWFKSTFQEAWDNVKAVFADDGEVIQGMNDTMGSALRSTVNELLGAMGVIISGTFSRLNSVFAKLKSYSFMGTYPFASLPTLEAPTIPKLAQGAVLPPNQPFMAIVGDQKSGTNVEAPLDTIKQAVAEVMYEQLEGMMAGFEAVVQAIQEKDTTAVISYRAIGEANNRYNNEMNRMRGYT